MAGDFPLAERSLLKAAGRSSLYQPQYLLAQYYFRRRNSGPFWAWARAALNSAYGDVTPLLNLCWRERPDAAWLTAHVLPRRPDFGRQYLTFLTGREQWEPALAEARSLAGAPRADDRAALLDYCDARLAKASAADAREIWNALCRRGLLPDEPLGPAHWLTNGEFLHAPSARGFDWRLVAQTGVRCDTANGEMRISFNGRQPERCPIAWQYVALEPGVNYRLRCDVFGTDGDGARAITWEAPDAKYQIQPDGSMTLASHRELGRIILVYQRPFGTSRLEGSLSVSRVRLERVP
jgi:hypothetical protein